MARIDGGALAFAVLHDLVGAAAFVATHPLHAAYAYFFSRGLLALAAFFRPLLLSTSLLLVVLLTAAPYVAPGWAGARCLGSTCGIALAALCAGMRPDGAGLGLVGQLCSFVLGPAGVGEIALVGESCDDADGGSCFLLEDKSFADELPLWSLGGEEICFMSNADFYAEEEILSFKDEIQEKNVVSEDLKAPDSSSSSSEHCFPGETFMPEMGEQEKSINKVQSLGLPEREGGSDDGAEEKRLECDPAPPSAMETKKGERVSKPHSLISQRIRQWESGNVKQVVDENPVEICLVKESFKGVDEATQLETESWDQKQSEDHLAQESIDVKEELVQWKVAEKCIGDLQDDAQPDGQGYQQEQEQEDADSGESPLRSTTSIARRVHARTSSENVALAGEGSPGPGKGKEWKRTLACKLYEERAQLKLCRDRAVAGPCADDMDMLWEAYETGGGSNVAAVASDAKRGGGSSSTKEAFVDEEEEEEDDEGPVPALCCLQALKFSTRKMSLGGGKPSMAKFSRVLKRMTALSRVGSRRKG